MKLVKINLSNFKSIDQSGDILVDENVTIFAGKNNTGKTSIIEAIYKVFNCNLVDYMSGSISTLEMIIRFSDAEFNSLEKLFEIGGYNLPKTQYHKVVLSHEQSQKLTYINCFYGLNNIEEILTEANRIDIIGNHSEQNSIKYYIRDAHGNMASSGRPNFLFELFNLIKETTVFITGNRYVPDRENAQLQQNLNINGTNLNAYMYSLHNNNERVYDIIVNTFKEIFNDVTDISTHIDTGNQTNISLNFEGLDFSIPLYNCGSGFTHVLMFLCVLYSQEDKIVLFDEPHVYLHPSAEKAIYDLINEKNNHQYLLTTHSPILINYPFRKHLYLVSKKDGVSVFTKLDSVGEVLRDIGVSNSDFALSEKVLFVEGETEEAIIPMILAHFGMKHIGYNYRVLKMKGTGNEFSKKSAMQNNKDKLDLVLGGISDSPIPYTILIDLDEKDERRVKKSTETY